MILVSGIGYSQSKLSTSFIVAPLAGFGHSTKESSSVSPYFYKPRLNFKTGVELSYFFSDRVGLRTGIAILNKNYGFGFKHLNNWPIIRTLEVPIWVLIGPNSQNSKLLLGMSFDWNTILGAGESVSASGTGSAMGLISDNKFTRDQTFSKSVIIGYEYQFRSERKHPIRIGLSYHYGIKALHELTIDNIVFNSSGSNQHYVFTIKPRQSYLALDIGYLIFSK